MLFRSIPGIQQLRELTKTAFNKQVDALRDIETYRKECNAFMQNPQQAGEGLDKLNKAREQAQKSSGEVRTWLKDEFRVKNKAAYESVIFLGNKNCSEQIKKNHRFYTVDAEMKIERGFLSACNVGLSGDAKRDRKAEAASTISNGDKERQTRIEEVLTEPKKPANREESKNMILAASEFRAKHPELNLPDPQKNSRDYICGERCAAIQAAMRYYNPNSNAQNLEFWDAIERARATQLGIYGTVYQ